MTIRMRMLLFFALVFSFLSTSCLAQSGSTHRAFDDLNPFRLPERAVYVNSNNNCSWLTNGHYLDVAKELVQSVAPGAAFRVAGDHYIGDNGVAHVYFRQTFHGLDIENADFNVNIQKNGSVLSYGNSFLIDGLPEASTVYDASLSDPISSFKSTLEKLNLPVGIDGAWAEAIRDSVSYMIKGVSGSVSDPTAKLVYFITPNSTVALTWKIEINTGLSWIVAYVGARSGGEIHGVVDYVSHASYQVYKWGLGNPLEGSRSIVSNPWDISASPFTWIGDGTVNYTTTRGNNAIAQYNPSGHVPYLDNFRPNSPELKFEYSYSPSMLDPSSYVNASIAQIFYTVNTYHDLLYTLGFNEKAGNFQWNNNGKGGIGGDYVIVDVQDGYSYDYASFSSPADGQPGRLKMGIWHHSHPYRDGSFDAGITIHEYTHGLSSRLTGGPANPGCLFGLEAEGMSEGWSDFMAVALRVKSTDTRASSYPIGEWAENITTGLRPWLYSTSMSTNPLTYASVSSMEDGHQVGNVWGNMLYEILWNLIDKHGNTDESRPTFLKGAPGDGRYLTMKLVIDGMALQPCTPKFLQARDAILDADTVLTNGSNHCDIWKGFAKRGLGEGCVYSAHNRIDSFKIPTSIC
ncbi:extracellular elastinolytic metallo proteinase [Penicillium herquei]|nr:extracellular elastinolytic metallo proteinase [Penicillium herquei]